MRQKTTTPILLVALHVGNWGALLMAGGCIAYAVRSPQTYPGEGLMIAGGIMMGLGGGFALLWSVFETGREDTGPPPP